MTDAAAPLERELVLQRFFALAPKDQLASYRVIRDYLAARIRETRRDRLVEERAAALDAFAAVVEHLGLEPGRAPTAREFDTAARELGLDWNRGRVQRLWGRWRFASEAFRGERTPESADRRAQRRAAIGRSRGREAGLVALRLWLRDQPSRETVRDYETWAAQYNGLLPDGEVPLPTAATIRRWIPVTWRDAVKMARGELSADKARPPQKAVRGRRCRGPYKLIPPGDVEALLGLGRGRARAVISGPSFPRPVIVLDRLRLWVKSDVVAYKNGRPFPKRKTNEFRSLYLTTAEVIKLTGLSRSGVDTGAKKVPAPAVQMSGTNLWLRSELDEWLKRQTTNGRSRRGLR